MNDDIVGIGANVITWPSRMIIRFALIVTSHVFTRSTLLISLLSVPHSFTSTSMLRQLSSNNCVGIDADGDDHYDVYDEYGGHLDANSLGRSQPQPKVGVIGVYITSFVVVSVPPPSLVERSFCRFASASMSTYLPILPYQFRHHLSPNDPLVTLHLH